MGAFSSILWCLLVPLCVCVCFGLQSAGTFFIVGWYGSNPWWVPYRGSFFHCRVVGFQPLLGACSVIFSQLLDSRCAYIPGSVRMTYLWPSLSISTSICLINRCASGANWGTIPLKDMTKSPTLKVWTQEFSLLPGSVELQHTGPCIATAREPYTQVFKYSPSKNIINLFESVTFHRGPDHELISKYQFRPLGHAGTI